MGGCFTPLTTRIARSVLKSSRGVRRDDLGGKRLLFLRPLAATEDGFELDLGPLGDKLLGQFGDIEDRHVAIGRQIQRCRRDFDHKTCTGRERPARDLVLDVNSRLLQTADHFRAIDGRGRTGGAETLLSGGDAAPAVLSAGFAATIGSIVSTSSQEREPRSGPLEAD